MDRKTMCRQGSRSLVAAAIGSLALVGWSSCRVHAQQASVSAWDAADFRVWAYIPYWTTHDANQRLRHKRHVLPRLRCPLLRRPADRRLTATSPRPHRAYQTSFNTIRTQSQSAIERLRPGLQHVRGHRRRPTPPGDPLYRQPHCPREFLRNLKTVMVTIAPRRPTT